MSDLFSIHIDLQNPQFQQALSAGRSGSCDIHIVNASGAFPSDPFPDFPIIILQWWLENLSALSADNTIVENSFMNGPFYFTTMLRGDTLFVTFRQRRKAGDEEILPSVQLPTSSYRDALISSAELLIHFLNGRGYSSPDITALAGSLAEVHRRRK